MQLQIGEPQSTLKAPEALNQVLLLLRDILQSSGSTNTSQYVTVEQRKQTYQKVC